MAWTEVSLNATDEAVDWVYTLLAEMDDIDEIQVAQYVQPEPPSALNSTTPNWTITLRLYVADDGRTQKRVETMTTLLSSLHRTHLTTAPQLAVVAAKPARPVAPVHPIGKRFVVTSADLAPSRTEEHPEKLTLRLRPSLAFGSGLHPATHAIFHLLERHVAPGMNALDLGCGSGILSVAMAKLGAQVLALDNDRLAVQATQDAVDRNDVAQQVTVMEGSLGAGSNLGHWMGGKVADIVPTIRNPEAFDLIVANILARVHIALAPDFRYVLRRTEAKPGLFIAAGFTSDYEEDVTTALKQEGFEVFDCERLNEWVALAYRLSSAS